MAGEQDEELSRWEQEQIRKGINIPQACISFELFFCFVSAILAKSITNSGGLRKAILSENISM